MTATDKQKSQQLSVKIKDGQLQISIGIALLAFATQQQNQWPEDLFVSDIDKFSKSLASRLRREQEDGTTPVHRMLDQAADEVIEQGDDGVDDGNVEDGIAAAKAILDAGTAEGEADDKITPDQAWTILCETPDITSPEEYPDHALITAEQLRNFMERAI